MAYSESRLIAVGGQVEGLGTQHGGIEQKRKKEKKTMDMNNSVVIARGRGSERLWRRV